MPNSHYDVIHDHDFFTNLVMKSSTAIYHAYKFVQHVWPAFAVASNELSVRTILNSPTNRGWNFAGAGAFCLQDGRPYLDIEGEDMLQRHIQYEAHQIPATVTVSPIG